MRQLLPALLLLFLASQSRAETLVGTVASVRGTAWTQACGRAVKDFYKNPPGDCMPIDGDIVAIKISNAHSLTTLQPIPPFVVLVPAPVAKNIPMSIVVRTSQAQSDIS